MTELQRFKSIFWTTSVLVALCIGGIVFTVYKNKDMRIEKRSFLEILNFEILKLLESTSF